MYGYLMWGVSLGWLKQDKKIACCLICKPDISLSNMGCCTLDEHARGQKHQKWDQSWNQSSLFSYFSKTSRTNSTPSSVSEQSECRIRPLCPRTLDDMIISESTLNTDFMDFEIKSVAFLI